MSTTTIKVRSFFYYKVIRSNDTPSVKVKKKVINHVHNYSTTIIFYYY